MSGVEIIPLVGLALTAIGTGTAVYGATQAAEASQDAEDARKQQMNLDATRRRRAAIRESIVARGLSVNTAAAQGASEGSAIAGSIAQISGNAGESISNTNQNVQLGNKIFDANGRRAASESISGIGQGLQSWGQMVMSNADKIRRLPEGVKGLYSE